MNHPAIPKNRFEFPATARDSDEFCLILRAWKEQNAANRLAQERVDVKEARPEFTEAASRLFANDVANKPFSATRVCGKDWRKNSLQGKRSSQKKSGDNLQFKTVPQPRIERGEQ